MKTRIAWLALSCILCTSSQAQNNIKYVPANAAVILKYAAENFSKNVSVKKLDSYQFIKDDFFKMIHLDKRSSLQNTGINFDQDVYQYVSLEDTCINFVTVLPLKSEAQFLKLIKSNYTGVSNIVKNGGFNFLYASATTYIGWNKTMAVIVNSNYQNRKSYYSDYYGTSDTTTVAMVDTAMIDTDYTAEVDTAMTEEQWQQREKKEEERQLKIDEEIRINDSINSLKWELFEQQQDMIAKKQQQAAAEKIIAGTFSGNIKSIEGNAGYKKIIDPAAHISAWMNAESVLNQYMNYFNRGYYGVLGNITKAAAEPADGFKSSVNVYFEKDKLRMEQKSFSPNPQEDKLALNVMNSKQSSALVNYVNPGNIGYFSMSMNTEAMVNYYYTALKKYMSGTAYLNEFSPMIDVYIDLLEIIIDEKGIAELLPGNYMFVMHDMKPQMVDYTDYEYDEEYNQKEVKKSRKELSPDFTFAFETRKEGFMDKLARLPLKYAEKEKFDYKEKDGYYVYTFDSGKYPISNLYFMIKDGKGFITTSAEVINMAKNNIAYAIDAETKNSILNNNYSLQLNSKKLIEKLQTQFGADVNKKISDYLLQNVGNVKMESSVKDGMIQSTATMNITGSHSNSLEFFFNIIDGVNTIVEKDKQEKDKKIY